MKKSIILASTILLILCQVNLFSQSQNYGTITYGKAVNISGKQRMLSQKMSKAYLLMAKGINDDAIKKELNSSKFIFEKQLQILTKNATSTSVKLSLKKVNQLWEIFKEVILSNPDFQNSTRVMKLNTDLLKACNKVVISIENNFNYNNQFFQNKNKELVNTINVSGKQRMLAQRLCLYYIATTIFKEGKPEYKKTLSDVFTEFDNAIGNLLINSYNSTEIEEELGLIMSYWEKFQLNKKGLLNNDFPLQEIFLTTNELTKSFNKITGLYEGIANN
ncbi:type IV pili methyl-accepting chemotaxis transducer N-terminal domain-containing protein [Aquimarina sp. 2201CG14-23]|uniref:type IV pili methyl-accepting chemotaxis transducer N-terminal domain-containing protein n=1 Tax=Aquimarina mycalae TaxID=3040073 RepID=UPI002477CEE5|nr:type IV pili methyl-accepting chemotaxis transducer N-terminal domain-containing protein [Aquimarina sp. 2201CG14-23]MDH7444186.1 type IV pili methyl-accepting chemotaxis transducer N-terminal domain-containing protein [Aquimarina sp. 2201CG14-23]